MTRFVSSIFFNDPDPDRPTALDFEPEHDRDFEPQQEQPMTPEAQYIAEEVAWREHERDAHIRAVGMQAKLFEVRDRGLMFIPVMAVRLGSAVEAERYLAERACFGKSIEQQGRCVVLVHLGSMQCASKPSDWDGRAWDGRTLRTAHIHIAAEFDRLEAGAVIDAEYLRGETETPKESERLRS